MNIMNIENIVCEQILYDAHVKLWQNLWKKTVPIMDRPVCMINGCMNKVHHTGIYNKSGYPKFRSFCFEHHLERCREKSKDGATLTRFFYT